MKISARNVLRGIISTLHRGAVNTEVTITLSTGEAIVSVITNASADVLGLKREKEGYAIIKATSVMIGKDLGSAKLSVRNALEGTIKRITPGEVEAEVLLLLAGGYEIVAVITTESVNRLGLKEGDVATALIKSSSVIVGVD